MSKKKVSIFDMPHTGYLMIDGILETVKYARANHVALKTIYMKPGAFVKFCSEFQQLSQRELLMNEPLMMDGVNIEHGDLHQRQNLLFEFYEQPVQN